MFPYCQPLVLIVLKRRVWIFSVHDDLKVCYVLGNRGDESAHALSDCLSIGQKNKKPASDIIFSRQ